MKTSIKLKLRPSSVPDREGALYFQFIRNREVKVLTTSYKLFPEEWNPVLEKVRLGCSSPLREAYLQQLSADLLREYQSLEGYIHRMERSSSFCLGDFVRLYRTNNSCCLLSALADELEQSLIQMGRVRTARAYRDAARNFIRFNDDKDFALDRLDTFTVKAYESYMLGKGNALNTVSFYMRNLRVIHRIAVNRQLIRIPNENFFAGVFTGVSKTKKRAVRKEVLEDLVKLDFSVSTRFHPDTPVGAHCMHPQEKRMNNLEFTRDLFVLSFYLRGISFIDLAYLRKKDVRNGIITYRRHKTAQYLEIALTPEMKEIIGCYTHLCKNSDYLLPILGKDDSRKAYESVLNRQNRNLKKLSGMIGLEPGLTTYVARHSWATIARRQGIPVSLISQGLGHESEKTTMIYLDSFDYTLLHAANQEVINRTKKAS